MVEHNLAKVGVASSNLVSRSRLMRAPVQPGFFVCGSEVPAVLHDAMISPPAAGWQSGHAAACKAVYVGSIPVPASILTQRRARLVNLAIAMAQERRQYQLRRGCDGIGRRTRLKIWRPQGRAGSSPASRTTIAWAMIDDPAATSLQGLCADASCRARRAIIYPRGRRIRRLAE